MLRAVRTLTYFCYMTPCYAASYFAETLMNTSILTRLAAGCAMALGLAACGADHSNGINTNTNTSGQNTASQFCAQLQTSGAITSVQNALCDLTNNTPVGPLNDMLDNLIGTSGTLGGLTSALEALIGPDGNLSAVNDLLTTLLGSNNTDGSLTPLIIGLNTVLQALNAGGDPAAIAEALSAIGAGNGNTDGGTSGPTGTPLDAILTLGGEANPLATLLAALPSEGSGNSAGGSNTGLITSVQGLITGITSQTQLAAVAALVDELLSPQSGTLSGLTSALEALTAVNGGPLGPLTEVVNGLIANNDATLAPVIIALNIVLQGLLTKQDPTAIAAALQGLAG